MAAGTKEDATGSGPRREAILHRELERVDGHPPDPAAPLAKHRKMAANPFRFLRGAAQIYYADMKAGRIAIPPVFASPPHRTLVMGDCHLSNFGFMTEEGSHSRRVIFAPNDFDDACVGPAAWDLVRFIASLFLAAGYGRGILEGRFRSNEATDTAGLAAPDDGDAEAAARAFLEAYRRTCQAVAADPERRQDALQKFGKGHCLRKPYKKARRRAAGGRDFARKSALGKAVEITADGLRFRDRPDRYRRLDAATGSKVRAAFRPYVDDAVLDVVARLDAGTGSVGMERYYLLVGPEDFAGPEDLPLCHVVEVKQQRAAAPLFHFPDLDPVNGMNPAHLTVDCQRRMQRRPDLVLDEVVWQDRHWLVRSRHHARVSLDPEDLCLLPAQQDLSAPLRHYAAACGQALALAHARGDRRSTRFESAMARALKAQGAALIAAGRAQARRSEADCDLLRAMLDGN
ncbi:DUF2252 family protein [Marinibaculum pumilum]|uniref:DUF2252 family protein n=1 Tax=Marinibaculum pumilum TaxID=1766165 RepID=A0ABV7L646_9PROT